VSEHFLESDVAILKRQLKGHQEIVANLAGQLDRAQEVILASLPVLRQACKSSYDWHEQEGVEARFLREDNTIDYCLVRLEARKVLGFE